MRVTGEYWRFRRHCKTMLNPLVLRDAHGGLMALVKEVRIKKPWPFRV